MMDGSHHDNQVMIQKRNASGKHIHPPPPPTPTEEGAFPKITPTPTKGQRTRWLTCWDRGDALSKVQGGQDTPTNHSLQTLCDFRELL